MENKSTQATQLLDAYSKVLRASMHDKIRISENLATLYALQTQNSIKAMKDEITKNLSSGLSEYVRLTMHENLNIKLDMANALRDAFQNIDFKKIESELSHDKEAFNLQISADDYVIFDESTVKELDISETIAIPIGHNRVKMKTSDFVALLALIATVIGFIYNAVIERSNSSSNDTTTQKQIELIEEHNQLEREQNQILANILTSADYSNSSNQEYLEELSEYLLNLQSGFSELQDTVQALESTAHDSDYPSRFPESNSDNHSTMTDNANEYQNVESAN